MASEVGADARVFVESVMAQPKIRVIDCPAVELEAQLEPLVDDYAIIQAYWRDRGEVTWATLVLGKMQKHMNLGKPAPNNFRPRG